MNHHKIALAIFVCVSNFALAVKAVAQSCGGHCDPTPPIGCAWMYCDSLNEWLVVDPIIGKADFTPEELVGKRSGKNCSGNAISTPSLSYTYSESISHTETGTLKAEVAFKVGKKDVSDVGLTAAKTNETQWQWVDSLSKTETWPSKSVPACSNYVMILYGKHFAGHHQGSGRWEGQIEGAFLAPYNTNRTIDFSCQETSSFADGDRWFVVMREEFQTSKADCQPVCKACK